MLVIWLWLYFMAVFADAATTQRRIKQFGPEIELNKAIRYVIEKLGLTLGIALTVIAPAAMVIGLLVHFKCSMLIAGLTGFRLRHLWQQLRSAEAERQLLALFNSRVEGSDLGNPPRGAGHIPPPYSPRRKS